MVSDESHFYLKDRVNTLLPNNLDVYKMATIFKDLRLR